MACPDFAILCNWRNIQVLAFFRISRNVVSYHRHTRYRLVCLWSYIIKGCCKAIVKRMASKFLKTPSIEKEWLDISKRFWNYPHALGVVNGKHIRNQKPPNGTAVAPCITTTARTLFFKCFYLFFGVIWLRD